MTDVPSQSRRTFVSDIVQNVGKYSSAKLIYGTLSFSSLKSVQTDKVLVRMRKRRQAVAYRSRPNTKPRNILLAAVTIVSQFVHLFRTYLRFDRKQMSSREGPRAVGSDGSDFTHREQVALQYKIRYDYRFPGELHFHDHVVRGALHQITTLCDQ